MPSGKSRETVTRSDLAGQEFETFLSEELEAHQIRPDRKDEKKRLGKLGEIRR